MDTVRTGHRGRGREGGNGHLEEEIGTENNIDNESSISKQVRVAVASLWKNFTQGKLAIFIKELNISDISQCFEFT